MPRLDPRWRRRPAAPGPGRACAPAPHCGSLRHTYVPLPPATPLVTTKQAVEDYQQTLEAQGALGTDASPDLVSVRLEWLAVHL